MAGAVYTYTGNADPNRNNTAAIQTSQGKIAVGSSGLFLPGEVEGALGLGLIIKPGPALSPRSELSALTVAAGAAGNPNGAYLWAATFVTAAGETIASPTTAFSLANQQGSISAIPIGDPLSGVTARKIYRTVAGGAQLKLVTTINDNVTTVFSDNVADGSLGANVPTSDTSSVVSNQAITPPAGGGAGFNFATLTGNPADDTFAISAGTGHKLAVGGGGGGGGTSVPVFIQDSSTPPASGTGEYVIFEMDGAGNLVDILSGTV